MVWTCPICGRDRFDKKYQPHRCIGGFRKRGFGLKTMRNDEIVAILAEIIAFHIVKMTEGKVESVAK